MMHILKNCILLLKAEKSDESEDKYELTLTKAGYMVKYLKTLEFKFKNLAEIRNRILKPNNYDGIIFTTPRSVVALRVAIADDILNSSWTLKNNYVVGETTYDHALKEFKLDCKGRESGNAKNLADVIINDKANITKPLLLPCGNLKSDTLVDELNKQNIKVETVIVYETIASTKIHEDFVQVTANYTYIPEYFVYFSPSGVDSTFSCIKRLNNLDCIKFIAIGPTTEMALRNNLIKINSVALKPTPQDLLDAIIKS